MAGFFRFRTSGDAAGANKKRSLGGTNMQRRKFMRTAGVGGGGRCRRRARLPRRPSPRSMPELKWRLASSFPKSLDTLYGAGEKLRQVHRRGDGQQVPDPHLRRGRDRARPAGARRRAERHRRDAAIPPATYYVGKDPTLRLRHRAAVRHERAPAGRVAELRRRPRADATSSTRTTTSLAILVRQHRRPDGRLVPQGDQDASRT